MEDVFKMTPEQKKKHLCHKYCSLIKRAHNVFDQTERFGFNDFGGLFSAVPELNRERTELHNEICEAFGLERLDMKITDNLQDIDFDGNRLYEYLKEKEK